MRQTLKSAGAAKSTGSPKPGAAKTATTLKSTTSSTKTKTGKIPTRSATVKKKKVTPGVNRDGKVKLKKKKSASADGELDAEMSELDRMKAQLKATQEEAAMRVAEERAQVNDHSVAEFARTSLSRVCTCCVYAWCRAC